MRRTNKENKITDAMQSQVASSMESDRLDRNNNGRNSKNYEKYSLRPRSIQNRIETEKRQKEPKKKPKPKQKPPPLSKYRRKTANARERGRMREINEAFDHLQRAVPQYPILPVNAQGKTCEKLTKITTLRLAMNYIEALAQLLNNPPVVCTESGNCTDIESSYSSSPCSSGVSATHSSSSTADFSPASSFTMSPLSMTMSCSPAPDCIQTVMRSVVSPASAAATAAAAAALNSINNNSLATTTATNSNIPLITHHHHTLSVNPNNLNMVAASVNLGTISPLHGNLISQSPCAGMSPSLSPSLPVVASFSPPMSLSPSSICSLSPKPSSTNNTCSPPKIMNNHHHHHLQKTKLPPISSSLSSALHKRSMSSFIADCAQMTGVINNSGHRTGSLSSLTESDLSELLSDEGSTLDDPMFDDLIGVGDATDLELLLESDGDSLHFSSDLSNT